MNRRRVRIMLVFSFLLIILPSISTEADAQTLSHPATLQAEMDDILSASSVDDPGDFTFCMQRLSDGRRYVFSRGASSMDTLYKSASTSKLVSAVIILRLVEQGYLSLDDSPQDYLSASVWPVDPADPLYDITLAELLSFTSGLENNPAKKVYGNIYREANSILSANTGNGVTPGREFYYGSNHLQVAGAMAIRARELGKAPGDPGFASWQAVYKEFRNQTGLFRNSEYDLPLAANPRLAGGMHWTASDYMEFLEALAAGELLGPAMMAELLADYTPAGTVTIVYSPILSHPDAQEDWHYGFGLWQEYEGNPWAGTPGTRVSSPGACGAYPFWDISRGYIGIVARQSDLGSFPEGLLIERAVRSLALEWLNTE